MDPDEPNNPQNLSWWIASLAISIFLCAIFAGYMFDIKEDLKNAKIRDEIMEQRMDVMASEVDMLRRRTMVQQIQIVPSDKAAPAAAEGPAPETPAPAGQPAPAEVKPALPPSPVPSQPPKH